jgi:hypothetical protein
MAWVRGHYARRTRTGRRYGRSSSRRSPSLGVIVLIAAGIVLLIYLFNH